MMKTVFATAAARHSASTDMPPHKPVAGRVLTVTDRGIADRVYNLSVDGAPEFFVEGVLTHNCDALRYAVEGLHRKGRLLPEEARAEDNRLRPPRDYRGTMETEESWRV